MRNLNSIITVTALAILYCRVAFFINPTWTSAAGAAILCVAAVAGYFLFLTPRKQRA
jgi:membrane protein YdbS with pleckstrin-like domain